MRPSDYQMLCTLHYYEFTANMLLHEQMKQSAGDHTPDIKYSFCFTLPMITDVYLFIILWQVCSLFQCEFSIQ